MDCQNPECPDLGKCGGKCADDWAIENKATETHIHITHERNADNEMTVHIFDVQYPVLDEPIATKTQDWIPASRRMIWKDR